jgi:hypothetical protein
MSQPRGGLLVPRALDPMAPGPPDMVRAVYHHASACKTASNPVAATSTPCAGRIVES